MGLTDFIRAHRPSLRLVLFSAFLFLFGTTIIGIGIGAQAILRSQFLIERTEENLCTQTALVSAVFKASLEEEIQRLSINIHARGRPISKIPLDTAAQPTQGCVSRWLSRVPLPVAPDAVVAGQPDRLAARIGQRITSVLRESRNTSLTGIRVLDHNGIVIASSGSEAGLSLANRDEVQAALNGETISVTREKEKASGEKFIHQWKLFNLDNLKYFFEGPSPEVRRPAKARVFVNAPIILDDRVLGVVVASRTPLTMFEVVYPTVGTFTGIGVAIIIVSILLSILLAAKLSQPVYSIIERANRYHRGQRGAFKMMLRRPLAKEHKELLDSVSAMANELEKREEFAQHLASHTVHELSNPLTSIRGAVEILQKDGASLSDEERRQFLALIKTNTDNLDRLVQELHTRTSTDRVVVRDRFEVGLRALAQQLLGIYPHLQLKSALEDIADSVRIGLSPVAVESIIKSLIDNAYKHGGENVQVGLEFEQSLKVQGEIRILVSDTGVGIPEENRDIIFKPLFSTNPARAVSGLGLTNVRKLLELTGGNIQLQGSDTGTTFEISIPIL